MGKDQCVERVWDYPCSQKATKDGYCESHHPDNIAARYQAWEENLKKDPGYKLDKLKSDLSKLVAELRATGHKSGTARCATFDEHTRAMTEQQTLYYAADQIEALLSGGR